ncbi:MAG: succinyl-CoA synthetase subunit beta [Syntrophaceae bacterium PtaU1.Bin231]|nr:MAG: succinyl-CoA synthetase subunit beta [Syntrophaceae bacterium PtaU1.Bin231]
MTLADFQGSKPYRDLEKLLNPASIAILGASPVVEGSPAASKPSARLLEYLLRYRYRGKIYPINPKYQELEGVKCYARLADLPEPPDLVIIAIPAASVPQAVEDCAKRGVRNVMVISSGFGETGEKGKAAEAALQEMARRHGITVLGPNCQGFVSEPQRATPYFSTCMQKPGDLIPGDVALISQSGAIGGFLYGMANEQNLGLKYLVTLGNEMDLDVADVLGFLSQEPTLKAIGCYVEGCKDGRKFLRGVSMALQQKKPVAVMKVGRTAVGAEAAQSHTGSLAGEDTVYDAAFRQAGAVRVNSMQEMLDFLTLSRHRPYPKGNRLGVVSVSGGAGIWVADQSQSMGLELPSLAEETRKVLGTTLSWFAATRNPVDVADSVTKPDLLGEWTAAVLNDPNIDSVLVVMGIQEKYGVLGARSLIRTLKDRQKPVVVVWIAGPQQLYVELGDAGIPVFRDLGRGLTALAHITSAAGYLANTRDFTKEESPALEIPRFQPGDFDNLTEYETKKVLAQTGLRVPRGALVRTAGEVAASAEKIGFPLVMKLQSPKLLHKTEHGLVKLNVRTQEEAQQAFAEMMQKASALVTPSDVRGVLLEETVANGVEVIVGARLDGSFGPTVMFGLGGIYVELFKDVAFRLSPVTVDEALGMIREVRSSSMLTGFRGGFRYDVKALADAIVKISRIISRHGDLIRELEINPLMVLPEGKGVVAVDALVVGQGEN